MNEYIQEGSLVRIKDTVYIYGDLSTGLLIDIIPHNSGYHSNYKAIILYKILFKEGIHLIPANQITLFK